MPRTLPASSASPCLGSSLASLASAHARFAQSRAHQGEPTTLRAVYADDVVTTEDVRALALTLPRTVERLVRDQVKFRVGSLVYVAISRDETAMGFGFPKEERDALVAAEPEKFSLPVASDLRYNWVRARLAALDLEEMRELVIDAWRMVVPKRVAADHLDPR